MEVPAGAFDGPALVTMDRLEDPTRRGEGPLPTGEDQFPPFYEVEASEPPTGEVAIGTCVPTAGGLAPTASEAARLAITKTVTGDPSSAVRLEAADAGFLGCESGEVAVAGRASGFSTAGATATSFEQVAVGGRFACGLLSDGSVWCWGENASGQLGNGTTTSTTAPDTVEASVDFVRISAGSRHACGLTSAGDAWCWGANEYGQLGDRTTTDRSTPVQVSTSAVFEEIDAAFRFTCAREASGTVYCWGSNDRKQLGHSSASTCTDRFATRPCSLSPEPLASGESFAQVDAGLWLSCGVKETGEGRCWGTEVFGALGTGPVAENGDGSLFEDFADPQPVTGGLNFEEIRAGAVYACGLTSSGTAWCWGTNNGKMGNGTLDGLAVRRTDATLDTVPLPGQAEPVEVVGGHTFTEIATHEGNWTFGHSCAIDAVGDAWCWGANVDGELGTATSETCNDFLDIPCSTTPVKVDGDLTFSDIGVNASPTSEDGFSCGVSGGDVYCWGNNEAGQLGDGTTTSRGSPTRIAEPGTGIDASSSIRLRGSPATGDEGDAFIPLSDTLRALLDSSTEEGDGSG